jgi:hypothetical protein
MIGLSQSLVESPMALPGLNVRLWVQHVSFSSVCGLGAACVLLFAANPVNGLIDISNFSVLLLGSSNK